MTGEIQPELGTSSEAASEWSVGRQAVGSTCSVFWVREAAVGLICLRTLCSLFLSQRLVCFRQEVPKGGLPANEVQIDAPSGSHVHLETVLSCSVPM